MLSRSLFAYCLGFVIACLGPSAISAQTGEGGLPDGTELIAVYIGATSCAPCQTPETKAAIRKLKESLADQTEKRNWHFSLVGVGLDWDVKKGVELLAETAPFDEVIVGRNWANTGAEDLIWSDRETPASIPLVLLIEREVKSGERGLEFGNKRVIQRLVGAGEIQEWVKSGARIPEGEVP